MGIEQIEITLPSGYTMNCEPERWLSVEGVKQILQEHGFKVTVEEPDNE